MASNTNNDNDDRPSSGSGSGSGSGGGSTLSAVNWIQDWMHRQQIQDEIQQELDEQQEEQEAVFQDEEEGVDGAVGIRRAHNPNTNNWLLWGVMFVTASTILAGVMAIVFSSGNGSDDSNFFVVTTPPPTVRVTDAPTGAPRQATGIALMIDSVQDCFLDKSVTSSGRDGTFKVDDTPSMIPIINEIRDRRGYCMFDLTIRIKSQHPQHHISFASTHGLPPFAHDTTGRGPLPITCENTIHASGASCCPTYWVHGPTSQNCSRVLCPQPQNIPLTIRKHTLASPACSFCINNPTRCFPSEQSVWPDHCVANLESGIPPLLTTEPSDIVLFTGQEDYVDGYSAFMDNTRNIRTDLHNLLQRNQIHTLYLVGVTTDFSILWTAHHALLLGYKQVKVILDATRCTHNDTTCQTAIRQMKDDGIIIMTSEQFLLSDSIHYIC